MGKIVRHYSRITNWSVVPPFTKHKVDNEVFMLWGKWSHNIKELRTGV